MLDTVLGAEDIEMSKTEKSLLLGSFILVVVLLVLVEVGVGGRVKKNK